MLKRSIKIVVSLVGALLTPLAAHAADIVVNSATVGQQILAPGDSLTITGAGSISMVGGPPVAIRNNVTANFVDNSGALTSNTAAISIDSLGADLTGGVINRLGATITGGTNAGIAMYDQGDISGGVDNSGTIFGTMDGFYLNGANISGGIINSGTISAGTNAGLYLQDSDISGGVDNSGTISSGIGGTNHDGFSVTDHSDISGGIINRPGGTISGNRHGIQVTESSDISGGIINQAGATITGNSFGIDIQQWGRVSGGITNTGTIEGLGGKAISLRDLIASTPININGGRIIGDIIDDNPVNGFSNVTIGGNFTTEGDFDVSSITFLSGNTLTVGAGNTIAAQTLNFGASGAASFGNILNPAGAINLTGVDLNVLAGGSLVDGDEMKIADGTVTIIGGPSGTLTDVDDDSFLWNFQIADGTAASTPTDDTDLFLFASQVNSFSSQNSDVGDALADLTGTSDPVLQAVIDNMNNASTQAELDNVLLAVRPVVDGGAFVASQNVSETSFGLTDDRLASLDNGNMIGMSAGNGGRGLSAWGQVFGAFADQDIRNGASGYDADTHGIAFGVDTENILDPAVIGFAFSYALTNVNSQNITTAGTDVDSYQATVYGDYNLGEESFLRGMAAYTMNTADTVRHNVGGVAGATARGDFNADQYSLRGEFGRSFGRGMVGITPSLLMNFTHYSPEDYTETGAGLASLAVRQKDSNIFELGPQVRIEGKYQNPNGTIFLPELQMGYRHDFIGDRVETLSNFTGGGAAFSSQGVKPDRDKFTFGAGFTYQTPDNWDFRTGFDTEFKEQYQAYSGMIRATHKF